MVLDPVLGIMFLSEESRRLRVAVVWWLLDVKVLREVGRRLGPEINPGTQEGYKFGWVRFQFLSKIKHEVNSGILKKTRSH